MTSRRGPIKVLQVVGRMDRGGGETWLMHVLRHIDRERFKIDFVVHLVKHADFDDEIRELGGSIFPLPYHRRPWTYARGFRRLLREHGPYDVVHSQVHFYAGFNMWLARREGVGMRIAHSHADTRGVDRQAGAARKLYLAATRRLILAHATDGLAASGEAAAALFGEDWRRDPRLRVHYCGIDLAPFRSRPERDRVRAELGIGGSDFVIGHVANFWYAKNHAFLLEIAAAAARLDPAVRLLMIGEGPLRPRMEARARELGLESAAIFAGRRTDVARLMMGAMDVFVMPSIQEGLPLVGLEAQAAGLPALFSDIITPEVEIVPDQTARLSLDRPAEEWARTALALGRRTRATSSEEALARIEPSSFNIEVSCRDLERLYLSARERS